MKIVSLTSACVDIYDKNSEICPGGESLNFSASCCRYPHIEMHMIGAIGNDDYGRKILNALQDKPINIDCLHIVEGTTANNLTYLTDEGDRYYKEDSWTGGVYETFQLITQDIVSLSDAALVHTSINCPVFKDILELKKEFGFLLAVDFYNHRDFEKWSDFINLVNFFFISADESILPQLKEWSNQYPGVFIGTLAEYGSVAYQNGKEIRVPAATVPPEEIVDTTGCGDTYQAGFIGSYTKCLDIYKAMQEGSLVASQTLRHMGGFQ